MCILRGIAAVVSSTRRTRVQHIRESHDVADAGVDPVTENGRLSGMVVDRDTAIRVVAQGKDPQSTAAPRGGRLVGVSARADGARGGDDTQTGQVVQEISE